MKIASYRNGDVASYGLVTEHGIIDAGCRLSYRDLKAVLINQSLNDIGALASESPDFDEQAVTFLPVIPNPNKIFCVGINYFEHMQEGGREPPERPWIFMRHAGSVTGHRQPLIKPPEGDNYDWEVELGAVIGRSGRRISAANALDYVAGYTVFNDGSIRRYQRHSPLWTAGKNFHRSGSMGPWLVPRASVPDDFNLRMQTRINGATMQDDTVNRWHFSLPVIIEYISTWAELEPGDVIAMGTPAGVGFARTPPVWLQPGDRIELEIEAIGMLSHVVEAESPATAT
ncbi:MAG: fumarylacetoacetate hydrolase family protein [Pseudomonadota bacterium]